jgi:hypothetical protein
MNIILQCGYVVLLSVSKIAAAAVGKIHQL